MKKTTSWDYTPENYPKQNASALVTKQNRFSMKFLMLLLLFVGVSVYGWGQTTASSTWALTTDASFAIVGNVTSSNATAGTGVTGLGYSGTNGMYVNGLNSASRDLNDYFQYTITPTSGNNLTVTQIQLTHSLSNYGGSPKLAVYYSLNSDFSSATQVGSDIAITASTTTTLSSLLISVGNTQTLYVRVYGWALTASGTTFRNKAVSISGTTVAAGNTAPSLTTPTSASITTTSATLGATISGNGGVSISESGIVYGTSAAPTGTATATSPLVSSGAFTVPVTSLAPETKYYYRGYATNSYGTGYSSDGTFFTLSNAPTAQATNLSGKATSNTELNISWNAASFPASGATAKGYVLLRATSPNTPSLSNGNGAAPTAGTNTTIVSSTIAEAATSQASTSLSANTTYNYLLIPYCWDGTNVATYNYLTASAPTATATTFSSATGVTISNRTANSMDLSWTNGNGSGRIVVARATGNSLVAPTNGTSYTVNSNNFTDVLNGTTGAGNVVVYTGTGNSTTVTGLTAGTQYQFYVYEYNAVPNYATAANSAATYPLAAEPTVQTSGVTFSAVLATGFKIDFSKGDGANRIVIVKAGSAVDGVPVDATAYTANAAFSSGQQIGTGNRVVYNGTGASVTVTGLTANTTYHVAVFEFNGSGTTINYLTTSPATGSQLTLVTAPAAPTALTFGSVTYNSFTASFTAPGAAPTGYLVVRRKGAAVSETPAGGTVYTAGNSVGSVAANEVIYVGTTAWTNESQTALTDNTTYHYAVYSYAGTGTQTNYSSALIGSQTTTSIPVTTATAATDISTTGFTANWDAGAGATGYKLDVSTSSNFGTLTPATLSEGFESGLSSSGYASSALTLSSGSWSFVDGGLRNTDKNTGTYSCQLKASSGKATTPTLSFIGTLTFYAKAPSGSTTLTLNKIINGGTPVAVEDISITNVWVQYNVVINDNSTDIKLQFVCGSNYILIDDVSIGYNNFAPSFVPSYENITVTPTSKVVSGLSPNTTYYYRVRATSANSTSANSNVVSVLTLPAAPVASAASTVNALNFVANWTLPATGADSYTLDVATDENFNNKLEAYDNLTVTGTSQAISGLSRNTTYYYRVKSVNASGASVSNVISVSTGNAITVTGSNESAGSLADCADCDLVVNQGGHLTVNANKSFNSVTLKPGAKLTLNNGQTFAPGTFVLQSNASATATFVDARTNANKTNITATVQQHLPAASTRTWWYLASPVTGAASSVFGSNKVGDYSETTRSYSNPFTEATTLTAGKGYVVKMTATEAANYVFQNKVLNSGNIEVALTRTVTGTADNAKRGFNLVGNPYPSYLNWDMAYNASTNLRPTIWYRTLNGTSMEFHTYNATLNASVPSSANGYIPPMQAFWVKVDKDPTVGSVSNGILNFTNDMRSHDESVDGNPLKAPAADRNLVRLSISNGTLSDETVIATHPSASDSYDRFDSEKMANGDTNRPEIFSMAGNQELVINGISPLTDSKQIALGVRPGRAGNYTISLTEWRNTGNMEAVLRDNQLGEELILTESSSYSFDTDGNASTSRFSLLFRAKGSTTSFDRISSDLLIYASQKSIRVEGASLEGNAISIFNALGQPVFNGKAQSNRLEINGLTPAVYMVKVNNQTKMVIVK